MKIFKLGVVALSLVSFTSFAAEKKKSAKPVAAKKEAVERKDLDTSASKIEWVGKKTFIETKHNGTINIKSGFINLNGDKIVGGEVVIDMTTIKDIDQTADDKRKMLQDHLASEDFFNVAKFPEAKFVIASVDEKGNTKGKLTIRDKTNAIEFPATITKESGKMVATGAVKFDRTKYNVKYNSENVKAFAHLAKTAKEKLISDEIEITFNLVTK